MTGTVTTGGRSGAAHPGSLLAGPVVTRDALLAAREQRVDRRLALQADHPGCAVVVVSLVVPGPVKTSPGLERLRDEAVAAVVDECRARRWSVTAQHRVDAVTGPEAVVAVAAPATAVKRATTSLEDTHPVGRLWDLDVHDGTTTLSRTDLGLDPRRCLVCDEPGHACARARRHSLADTARALDELDARSR